MKPRCTACSLTPQLHASLHAQQAVVLDERAKHEARGLPFQNCAVLGARGNGITSRMFAMPVA